MHHQGTGKSYQEERNNAKKTKIGLVKDREGKKQKRKITSTPKPEGKKIGSLQCCNCKLWGQKGRKKEGKRRRNSWKYLQHPHIKSP